KQMKNSILLKFGVEIDNQNISLVDTTKKNRLWSTVYGEFEKNALSVKLGTTIAKKELIPYFNFSVNTIEEKTVKWLSFLRYEAIPKHLFFWEETNESIFDEWFTAKVEAKTKWKNTAFNISLDYFYNKETNIVHKYYINNEPIDISNNLFSSSISARIPIFREWEFDVQYRHLFEHNLYSDGIGDRVKIGLTATEKLFKSNLLASLRLWGDAYFNHHQNLGYEGFHYGPYATDDTNLALPDYWVFNLELSAKISKMTIMWKVNNILQTAESITSEIFPDLNDKYLLITNSNNFPPMNRFVSLNIIWNFEN
ncbi:MAG: hypothetical protein V3R52_00580, partial [Candidatus Neomarinimicrobiota bacterium]